MSDTISALYAQPAVDQPAFIGGNYTTAAYGQPPFLTPAPVAQFATFATPKAFAPGSGGTSFSELAAVNPNYALPALPYAVALNVGFATMAYTGNPILAAIFGGGAGLLTYAGVTPISPSMPNYSTGIPGLDPSAGSGAQ